MRESVGSLPSQTWDSWGLLEPPVPGAGGSLALCAGGRGRPSCCASFCCRCCFSSPWPGGFITPAATPWRGWGSIKWMAGDSGGPCMAWPLHCLLSVICVARRARGTVGRARHPESPPMSLCTDLCAQPPSAWVVIFYLKGESLFPQAHAPVWVALSRVISVISPPHTPWVFPSADKACLELCKTLWARRGRIPHPLRCQPDGSYCE